MLVNYLSAPLWNSKIITCLTLLLHSFNKRVLFGSLTNSTHVIRFLGFHLETLSYLIYSGAFFLQYRRDKVLKKGVLTGYYLIGAALAAYANWLLTQPQDDPRNYNDPVYNALFILTMVVITYYFLQTLTTRSARRIVWVLAVAILLVFTRELLLGRGLVFSSLIAALSYGFPVLCAFCYYYETLTHVGETNIVLDYDFWIIAAYTLHFLGNFFIVLAWDHLSNIYQGAELVKHKGQFTLLWSIHNLLLFLSAALILITTLWIPYRKASSLWS